MCRYSGLSLYFYFLLDLSHFYPLCSISLFCISVFLCLCILSVSFWLRVTVYFSLLRHFFCLPMCRYTGLSLYVSLSLHLYHLYPLASMSLSIHCLSAYLSQRFDTHAALCTFIHFLHGFLLAFLVSSLSKGDMTLFGRVVHASVRLAPQRGRLTKLYGQNHPYFIYLPLGRQDP